MVKTSDRKLRPGNIRIETSTVCQLRCASCPTATGETHEKIGKSYLQFEDFKKLVNNNSWIRSIELSNWGEIFLNPQILKIIEYAYDKKVPLTCNNGSNFNNVKEEVLEGLVKYQFRRISCALDGTDQATYEIYRRKGNFDQVINNIKQINHYKKIYNSQYPVLNWQFVVFGHNEHQIQKAREMAKELNMEFQLKLSWEDLYGNEFSPIKDKEMVKKEMGLQAVDRKEYRKTYGKPYCDDLCRMLWDNPQLNYDGKMLGCGCNYWGDFGNAFKEGLVNAINNEKMTYARGMLTGKNPQRADIPCTTCKMYQDRKKDNNWIKVENIGLEYEQPLFLSRIKKLAYKVKTSLRSIL